MNQVTDPSKDALGTFRSKITQDVMDRGGAIMGDDVISQLVQETLEKILNQGMYEGTYNTKEGWLRSLVRETYEDAARRHIRTYFVENSGAIVKLIKEQWSENGISILSRVVADVSAEVARAQIHQNQY